MGKVPPIDVGGAPELDIDSVVAFVRLLHALEVEIKGRA